MCSRSQCHRLWWMARRRFSHETQMANCLPSGLVKTKGKNSSIFFGGLSIVWFVFIVVNFVDKLLYLFDVWFKNWINESSFKMILSLWSTPRRDRNGIFLFTFPTENLLVCASYWWRQNDLVENEKKRKKMLRPN